MLLSDCALVELHHRVSGESLSRIWITVLQILCAIVTRRLKEPISVTPLRYGLRGPVRLPGLSLASRLLKSIHCGDIGIRAVAHSRNVSFCECAYVRGLGDYDVYWQR